MGRGRSVIMKRDYSTGQIRCFKRTKNEDKQPANRMKLMKESQLLMKRLQRRDGREKEEGEPVNRIERCVTERGKQWYKHKETDGREQVERESNKERQRKTHNGAKRLYIAEKHQTNGRKDKEKEKECQRSFDQYFCLSVGVSLCLSVFLCVCLCICLSVCLFIYLPMSFVGDSFSVCLSFCLCVCLSVCLPGILCVCMFVSMNMCSSICLLCLFYWSVYVAVCLPLFILVCLSVYIYMSICLPVFVSMATTGTGYASLGNAFNHVSKLMQRLYFIHIGATEKQTTHHSVLYSHCVVDLPDHFLPGASALPQQPEVLGNRVNPIRRLQAVPQNGKHVHRVVLLESNPQHADFRCRWRYSAPKSTGRRALFDRDRELHRMRERQRGQSRWRGSKASRRWMEHASRFLDRHQVASG